MLNKVFLGFSSQAPFTVAFKRVVGKISVHWRNRLSESTSGCPNRTRIQTMNVGTRL
jgi:hypothetical protein